MTGPHDSVIGVRTEIALRRFLTQLPARSEPALGDVRVEGALDRVRSRERARDANRDVPAAGVSARWRAARRRARRRAGTRGSRDRRTARTSAVIVQVRPSPAPLLPVAPKPRRDAPPRARAARPGAAHALPARGRPARRGERRGVALDRRLDRTARPAGTDRAAAAASRRARRRARPRAPARADGAGAERRHPGHERGRDGRTADVGAGPDGARRRRRRDRHGPRHRASRSSRPPPAAGSTRTTQHTTPFDESGHGTEVAEVVVSMAPDVRILAARVFSDGGRSTTSAVHRVFEWALDPDGNPRTSDAPSVLNGSWDDGGPGHCETEFNRDLAALRAAGHRPGLRRGQRRSRREHRREPCLGAGRGRGRQRDQPPTSSRRSRGAGRRRAAPRSSRRSRPTATGSPSAGPAARRSCRARRSPHRR